MSTSVQAACGHAQNHGNARCKGHGPTLCDNVYNPRQENQRVINKKEAASESTDRIDSPVGIYEVDSTKIDLPPLTWCGYETTPKCLTMRNTGRTIMINGQWTRGRPYLNGGPLNGTYIFSQIHFHCPSEHQVNGIRYPLEMHVVHYKTSYLTQEKATYEKDGTIVLVYLFQVSDANPTRLNHICKAVTCLDAINSSIELPKYSLDHIITPFASNYFLYWGSVSTEKNSYLLQWFVHRKIACVSRGEVNNLLKIMDAFKSPCGFTRMQPENGEIFLTDEDDLGPRAKSKTAVKRSDECKKCSSVQTCKSLSSLKSLCLRSSNSCCEKPNAKEECSRRSSKHVKISKTDGSTNTTPKQSKNDVSRSKKSVKVSEKESDCNSICRKESKKRDVSSKEEKSSKGKKEREPKGKDKEKKTKKNKSCEKIANLLCQSSSSCKSFVNEELQKSPSTTDAVCDAVDDIKTLYEKKQKKGKKKPDKKDRSKNRKDCDKNEEIQVNFLLTPNTICSNYSNVIDSIASKTFQPKQEQDEDEEEEEEEEEEETVTGEERVSKNCYNIPTQTLVKRNSLSETHLPTTNAENESKEFYLMMEHFFRSNNSKKNNGNNNDGSWNFQEYHVAIEYDHNILQEYNGMLHPDQLSLGNYEKLNLVPKYQDSKDLHIALTDCSIKLENTEDIRIRAKFLLKENPLTSAIPTEKRGGHDFQNSLDAGTQYTVQETDMANPFRRENIINSESDVEEYIRSQITKLMGGGKSSLKINDLREELKEELHTELRDELRNKLQQELRDEFLLKNTSSENQDTCSTSGHSTLKSCRKKSLRLEEPPEKPVDMNSIVDPIEVLPATKVIDSPKVQLLEIKKSKTKTEQLMGSKTKDLLREDSSEKSDRDLNKRIKIGKKNSREGSSTGTFSRTSSTSTENSNSKTTYFVYDRIEKDVNTGKKIFVGSFRTKEGTNAAQVTPTPSSIKKMKTLRKCSSPRDATEYSSDVYSNEKPESSWNKPENVAIHDILSQDSDLVKIDTWCNEQLSDDRSQRTQILSDGNPELDPDHNESLTLHKCQTENFEQRKKQTKGKGKKVVDGKDSHVNGSAHKQLDVRPHTSSAASSKRDLFKRNKTDKTSPSNNVSLTKSSLKPMAVSSSLSESKKPSRMIKSNVDKSVTNVQNKSTSFQWKDIIKENGIESEARSNSSRSRFSSRSARSKGTVIVIPIEVESLSKIELIVVEHTEEKSERPDDEYIPCLNCYKCLELYESIYLKSSIWS